MKRLLLLAAMALAANAVGATDAPPASTVADVAEKIRAGEINIGSKYAMSVDGRFHTVHTEVIGMGCLACHEHQAYQDDTLFMRKAEFPRRGHPGAVDPISCVSCHRNEGIATTWYGASQKRESR